MLKRRRRGNTRLVMIMAMSVVMSMTMVAIEDVVRADAMDAAGGAFNLFYLSAQCAH